MRITDVTAPDVIDDGMTEAERAAARRFGYRRRPDCHPIDAIRDARLAGTALALAIAELEWIPGERDRIRFIRTCRGVFGCSISEADEIVLLASWLRAQCTGQDAAAPHLALRLSALIGGDVVPDLERMVAALAPPGTRAFGYRMRVALDRSAHALRAVL
ncbi:MAG: hypothetical protein AAGC92_04780 [Pseudomonadota bacterium]